MNDRLEAQNARKAEMELLERQKVALEASPLGDEA
jgi:hypothetical protein